MIYDILPVGKENAITARQIMQRVNITRRDLSRVISAERQEGFPICASTGENKGFYVPADREELDSYSKSLESRIKELKKILASCEALKDSLPSRE